MPDFVTISAAEQARFSGQIFGPDGEAVAARRHVNPDGSLGGWIAEGAAVAVGAWIDARAVVLATGKVVAGEKVAGARVIG